MEPDPEWTSPPRDVPPPRPIPESGGRRRRRRTPAGAELAHRSVDPAVLDDAAGGPRGATEPDEPPWVRERREEAEFAREFGHWRHGGPSGRPAAVPRRSSRGTAMVPVLLLLVAVAVVLVAAL